jgi:hypothetical protein
MPPRPAYGCRSSTAAAGPDLPAADPGPQARLIISSRFLFSFLFFSRAEKKKKGPDMTDQVNGQIPVPGLAGVAAPPLTDDPRRCKQPGCGIELPAAAGRGAPRLFCSPACSRKWHNGSRAGAAGQPQTAASGALAGLQQLLAQAAGLTGAAAAELAAADPGRVSAALAAADAARRQAQAETAVAQAQATGAVQDAQAAAEAMHAARDDARAALEAADGARADADAAEARAQAIGDQAADRITGIRQQAEAAITQASSDRDAARAERDAALAEAAQARQHASTEISRARQAEADARAENDHVRTDAARERDAQAAACAAQIHTIQALAGIWQARAEHAEQQLSLEREHQRRLDTASPAPGGTPAAGGTRPARTARTASTSQP